MKRILMLALVLLLPNSVSEMSHSPKEVSEGVTFTALIDTEEDVVSVEFSVCTLEHPYTCYRPVEQNRENTTVDGRFEFTYKVGNNDYPGYKYNLTKEDDTYEIIPRQDDYAHYEGMEVVKVENPDPEKPDSYYFKVDVKAQDEEDDSLLSAPNLMLTVSIIAMITLINRR